MQNEFAGKSAPLTSLLDGALQLAAEVLGVVSVRHRSAALSLHSDGAIVAGSVDAVYKAVAANWSRAVVAGKSGSSQRNWRWCEPQLALGCGNKSAEVLLERALVSFCQRDGGSEWANQVPVASGIVGPRAERRRAIDIVHRIGERHFEFIELKVASDTPLFAALEIISYVCIWLLSRAEQRFPSSVLLEADRIDAKVLAPAAYYARYDLGGLCRSLNEELGALGLRHGVALRFDFEVFPDDLALPPFDDQNMLALVERRWRL